MNTYKSDITNKKYYVWSPKGVKSQVICKFKIMCFRWDLKEFNDSAKRMPSGSEFHSTGPAQVKDRQP